MLVILFYQPDTPSRILFALPWQHFQRRLRLLKRVHLPRRLVAALLYKALFWLCDNFIVVLLN